MTKISRMFLTLVAMTGGVSASVPAAWAATPPARAEKASQALIDLSRQKWQWMANRDVGKLEQLFHASARFVHMGATMDRKAELAVIRSGGIEYKRADISEISAEVLGDTAIVSSRLRLLAVVGGREVTNPFTVTEVYIRRQGEWKLATMAFTRLMRN